MTYLTHSYHQHHWPSDWSLSECDTEVNPSQVDVQTLLDHIESTLPKEAKVQVNPDLPKSNALVIKLTKLAVVDPLSVNAVLAAGFLLFVCLSYGVIF